MLYENNAHNIRKELLTRMIEAFDQGRLAESVDRIQLEMIPKKSQPLRCCVHKDRAVLNYRIKALLGFSIEDDTPDDELRPLADYVQKALVRTEPDKPVLTVIDEGCSSCVTTKYFVTNACKGCMARTCMLNCPKDAIDMVQKHAQIDADKCVNCGLCLKACPYHAIIYVPVPCEEACPTNAIFKDETGKEKIDYDKCIHCGKCIEDCPFGAIMEKSHIIDVIRAQKAKKEVVAMIAPAVAGQFSVDIATLLAMVKAAGFTRVYEVATGADITTRNEAVEFTEKMRAGQAFMTTSCCAAYIESVDKYLPELKPFVSHTKTPMYYTAELAAQEHPDSYRVFISPCVAKKEEALNSELVDAVISIEELEALFIARKVTAATVTPEVLTNAPSAQGRGFPLMEGVAKAVIACLPKDVEVKPVVINNLTKEKLMELRRFATKGCPGNMVEVMACPGGCVGGPNSVVPVRTSLKRVQNLMDKSPDINEGTTKD